MGPCCTQYNKQYKSIVCFFFFFLSALGLIHFFEKKKLDDTQTNILFWVLSCMLFEGAHDKIFFLERAASRCVWSGKWAVREKKEADTLLLLLQCQK
jgi:hypothetical protein